MTNKEVLNQVYSQAFSDELEKLGFAWAGLGGAALGATKAFGRQAGGFAKGVWGAGKSFANKDIKGFGAKTESFLKGVKGAAKANPLASGAALGAAGTLGALGAGKAVANRNSSTSVQTYNY